MLLKQAGCRFCPNQTFKPVLPRRAAPIWIAPCSDSSTVKPKESCVANSQAQLGNWRCALVSSSNAS
jgi:hypothetical protein